MNTDPKKKRKKPRKTKKKPNRNQNQTKTKKKAKEQYNVFLLRILEHCPVGHQACIQNQRF